MVQYCSTMFWCYEGINAMTFVLITDHYNAPLHKLKDSNLQFACLLRPGVDGLLNNCKRQQQGSNFKFSSIPKDNSMNGRWGFLLNEAQNQAGISQRGSCNGRQAYHSQEIIEEMFAKFCGIKRRAGCWNVTGLMNRKDLQKQKVNGRFICTSFLKHWSTRAKLVLIFVRIFYKLNNNSLLFK